MPLLLSFIVNLTIRQTFATWTVTEGMTSVVGLIMVLLLNQIVN